MSRVTDIPGSAIAVILIVLIAAVIMAGRIPGINGISIVGGAMVIELPEEEWMERLVGLYMTTPNLGNGNYETFANPQGTPFQVPAGQTLMMFSGTFPDDEKNPTVYDLGYGDDAVTDSVTPPTNNVDGFTFTVDEGSLHDVPFLFSVPSGKFPYIRFTGGLGTLDGKGSVWSLLFQE